MFRQTNKKGIINFHKGKGKIFKFWYLEFKAEMSREEG